MSKKTLFGLSAPIAYTMIALPAFSQADMPPVPPAQIEVIESGWTEVSVLSDLSSIDDKLERLYSDNGYKDVVQAMAEQDIKDGTINSEIIEGSDLSAYVTFIDSFTNPDITPEVLVGFGGFSVSSDTTDTLSKNISAIVDCRDDDYVQGQSSQLLKHKYVEGCAIETIKDIREENTPPLTNEILANYTHVDPRPIEEKLALYDSFKVRDPYYKNLKNRANRLSNSDTTATMYYKNYMQMWNAMLDEKITWENLQYLPEDSDSDTKYEFLYNTPSTDIIDNNTEFLFECRDELLPEDLSKTDLQARERTFNQIQSCWIDRTQKQHQEWQQNRKFIEEYAELDPRPLAEKIAELQSLYGTNNESSYFDGVKTEASALTNANITSSMYYNSFVTMWDSMLNPDITWDDLKDTPDEEKQGPEFYLSFEGSDKIDNNIQFMFDCRADHLPENLSETDMNARQDAFDKIEACWIDKTNAQYQQYQTNIDAINRSPYFSSNTTTVDEYRLLSDAFSNVSITAEDLNKAGLRASDKTTLSLSENFDAVLECRSAEVAKGAVSIDAETVAACAYEQTAAAYKKHRKDWLNHKILLILGFATPPALFYVGLQGLGAYRRKQQNKPKPN